MSVLRGETSGSVKTSTERFTRLRKALTPLLAGVALAATGVWSQAQEPADPRDVATPPSVVLILLDEIGMDMFGGRYQEVPDAPSTPNFDRVATAGVFFRNAWTNPYCSTTRAALLTGRYSFRTGIGAAIGASHSTWGLQLSEVTIPEALHDAGYTSAAIGKWHLAVSASHGPGDGLGHPLASGFDLFKGTMGNPGAWPMDSDLVGKVIGCTGPYHYRNWVKVEDGVQSCRQSYMTAETTDDAIEFVRTAPSPWFLYLPYNAIHTPFHDPSGLLSPDASKRDMAKAMMEALDVELGRLLDAIDFPSKDTYVILLGDNGTANGAAYGAPSRKGCYSARSKATVYEPGVNVPMAIAGPGIEARATDAIVNSTDVFATVCELVGVQVEGPEDSRSLVPLLLGSDEPVRDFVYAETFSPDGLPFAPTRHARAVFDGRYKLVRETEDGATTDELYDLEADPCEDHDLMPVESDSEAAIAYARLVARLVSLGVE